MRPLNVPSVAATPPVFKPTPVRAIAYEEPIGEKERMEIEKTAVEYYHNGKGLFHFPIQSGKRYTLFRSYYLREHGRYNVFNGRVWHPREEAITSIESSRFQPQGN